jgi:superfamily II DNA/RNA helicase
LKTGRKIFVETLEFRTPNAEGVVGTPLRFRQHVELGCLKDIRELLVIDAAHTEANAPFAPEKCTFD